MQARAENLNLVWQQLNGNRISKIVNVLDKARSTYLPPFRRLMQEVADGQAEASNMATSMGVLRPLYQQLQSTDEFEQVLKK